MNCLFNLKFQMLRRWVGFLLQEMQKIHILNNVEKLKCFLFTFADKKHFNLAMNFKETSKEQQNLEK